MQWFRMYHEFCSDPKIQMMSECMQRRFVMLLCLRCNATVTLHDEEIAFQLRLSIEEWKETKAIFIEKNFIDKDNNVLNWYKRQYVSDTSKERVSRYRERKRNANVTLCNVTVTPPDTDTDTDTDTEKKEEKVVFVFPDCIPKKQWDDFKAHRGKKFTKKAQELALKKLEGWHNEGYDIKQILENSVMNGWSGLFLPKDSKNQKANVKSDVQNQMEDILKNGW